MIIKVFLLRYYNMPGMCQVLYLCISCYLYLITTPMKTSSLFYARRNRFSQNKWAEMKQLARGMVGI